MSASENDRAYRVAGFPVGVSQVTAQAILAKFFDADIQATVRSLGPHPQTNSIVAIVMVSRTPSRLQIGNAWRLEEVVTLDGKSVKVRLEIDTAFLGFTPLNTAQGDESDKIDCIVVSGLSSHPFGSWKQRGGRFMWLVDHDENAPSVPPNVRALLYGYDTSLVGSESFQDVVDIGMRLASDIKGIRTQPAARESFEPRPIIFIAHSLGGLVVKEAICQLYKVDPMNAECVYGLVFFGVPHDGLLVEPWLRIIGKQPNHGLIEDLKANSRYLQRLNQRFKEAFVFSPMRVISVYETMTSKTAKEELPGVLKRTGDNEVIVTPMSAVGRWPDTVLHSQIGMNRNHENLPKFNGQFDNDYLALKPYLHEIWLNAVPDVQSRFDDETSDPKSEESPTTGLLQLWPPRDVEETSKIKTDVDIIAIHGLGGHRLKSWVDGEKLWLRDLLPWDLPKARVFTFGYDSVLAFLGPDSEVKDYAIQLLEEIRRIRRRDKGETQRNILFVCHSLGGIVFKQAFNLSYEAQSRYSAIGKSIIGVVFLGTPHKPITTTTSTHRYWPELLTRLSNVIRPRIFQPDEITVKSVGLGEICSVFEERGIGLKIFSLYELHSTPALGYVLVDRSSAILHRPNEATIPLEANHETLGRYLTSSSSNYLTVRNCIDELMETSSRDIEGTPLNTQQHEFLSELRAVNAAKVLSLTPAHWGSSTHWLLVNPEFQSWTRVEGRQAIWLYGPPGSGKTVLMRSTFAYLEDQREQAGPIIHKPVHFFFDDKDPTRRTSDAFVRSILQQILRDSTTESLIEYLESDELKTYGQSEEGLWLCLSRIVAKSHGIIFQFVIDAIDEVLRNTDITSTTIIDRLQNLLTLDSSGRVRFLMSSRTKTPYELSQVTNVVAISVDNDMTRENVEGFVRSQVRKHLERSHISLAAGKEAEKKIIERSRGNFLHAKLAWEQFSKGLNQWSRDEINEGVSRLEGLSMDLVSAYCELLGSIPSTYTTRARVAFAILRVSKKRLTSRQLAFLATLQGRNPVKHQMDLTRLDSESADLENYLSEACGFIIRKTDDGTVDFAHVSARDLFSNNSVETPSVEARRILSQYTVPDPDAHAIMHSLCMKTYQLEDRSWSTWQAQFENISKVQDGIQMSFGSGRVMDASEQRELIDATIEIIDRQSNTPCFRYALEHWFEHYDAATPSHDLDRGVISFLSASRGVWCHLLWTKLTRIDKDESLSTFLHTHANFSASAATSLFRALARSDCPRIVKAVLAEGIDINMIPAPDDGVTLLAWAIACQRRESFRTLLRNEDIQVNCGLPLTMKPIHHAVRCENPFYLQTLIDHPSINVNITWHLGTALHTAISAMSISAVQTLLDHPEIDIWAKDRGGATPYSQVFLRKMWGPVMGKMITVASDSTLKLDIANTSQIFLAGLHGWTDLEEKILRIDPMQLLAVDPSTKMNALVHYAYFGRREKLLWILDRLPHPGFPIRTKGARYDVLHLCANQGWEDIVHLLRRRYKLKSLRSDHVGRTLLHWALEHEWNMDRMDWSEFDESGLNIQDRDGLTALHIAVVSRNMDAIDLLVSSGANCMLKDKRGMTPAHLAAELGFQKALEYFIQMPQREFGRTRGGASLLHVISLWFGGLLVRNFIVTKRALVNVVDKQRRTPLHYACMANNLSAAEHLVRLGAMVNLRDENGRTPLHEAIRGNATGTALLLLDAGADYKATDAFGQNCLHMSLRYGSRELVQRFLGLGVDINAIDSFGLRPIHRACGSGHVADIADLIRSGADWSLAVANRESPLDSAVETMSVDVVEFVIASLENSALSPRRKKAVLDHALRVASEFEFTAIEQILLKAGAYVDRRDIKVKRWYMPGAIPEHNRLPLVSYFAPRNPEHINPPPPPPPPPPLPRR
ncbi:ankyrin repeat protein [Lasiosphaeria hispida]|uniref:Ankyrin repeat protein n=1 Tax=Lasiosphaeria hispida TaxID=260671 RepID=A0AAJ0MDF5_9PEZI|nr:ankyrin repeat protein [Lasiosphaeria hispida]